MTTFTYLGGPMRGYPNFNFAAFDKAAARLRDYGHDVKSPAEHDRENGFDETLNTLEGFDFAAAFKWDLDTIEESDIVVFLPGWEHSTGCAAEYAHARRHDLDVYAYRPADDDPTAPFGFRLDMVPEEYTPEVNPLDIETLSQSEPVDRSHVSIDESWLNDGFGNRWEKCANGCEMEIVRPGKVQCDLCDEAHIDCSTLHATVSSNGSGNGGEIRITNALTGGAKGKKPARFDLIPMRPLWQLAELYDKGAEKYADNNWRKGYYWSLSFAALQRHAWLFWSGEDIDRETGCHHLTSVIFHAMTMLEYSETHPELDDRYTGDE